MAQKKKRIFIIAILTVFVCTGCAKQKAVYEPKVSYVYNDVQDVNSANFEIKTPEAEGDYVGMSKEASNDNKQDKKTNQTKEIENHGQIVPEEKSAKRNNELEGNNISDNKNKANKTNNGTPESDNKDANSQNQSNVVVNKENGNNIENNHNVGNETGSDKGNTSLDYSDENGNENMKSQEDSQSGNSNVPSENNSDEGAADDGNKENEKQVRDLSCEGELGTYIWGEYPDCSALTVTVTFMDGHQEEVIDYEINMNYPQRFIPIIPGGFYGFETVTNSFAAKTYMPGIYNATVSYGNVSIETPYTLIITSLPIDINHKCECRDPENHETYEDELGHIMCWEDECLVHGKVSQYFWPTNSVGHVVRTPFYYDYAFTEEDLVNDMFVSNYLTLSDYYKSGFPAYGNKFGGVLLDEYEYCSFGCLCNLTAYDLRNYEN